MNYETGKRGRKDKIPFWSIIIYSQENKEYPSSPLLFLAPILVLKSQMATSEENAPAPPAAAKETVAEEKGKRRLEQVEAELDQLLEQEKGFRKKRWMAIIEPMVKADKPIELRVDKDDGVGLRAPGEDTGIELAHNGLYYYEGDFDNKTSLLFTLGVDPGPRDASEEDEEEEEEEEDDE